MWYGCGGGVVIVVVAFDGGLCGGAQWSLMVRGSCT